MESLIEPEIQQNSKLLEVGTVRIGKLLDASDTKLSVPEFQRPYVWDERHIEELIKDWKDHFYHEDGRSYKKEAIEYYLGSIIVHNNNGKLDIIDGQQRITTLLIMDYVWNNDDSALEKGNFNLNYHSRISFQRIKSNKNFLKKLADESIAKDFIAIASKLVISVIITNREDEAFSFFDSQNNRGIPLDEIDFFKSYHLRELQGKDHLLRYFAKKFDQINIKSKSRNSHGNLNNLNELFVNMLWRTRYWSKGNLWFPTRRNILDTFQKNTLKLDNNDDVRFYPNRSNMLGASLTIDENLNKILNSSINFSNLSGNTLPFSINQPIQKGVGFFLFTEKYDELYELIFIKNKINYLVSIHNLVKQVHNSFFINLYQLAIVSFFDKFGENGLLNFALHIESLLGAFRMNRASIQEQSPIVLLRDDCNILQIIQNSYLPSEVISEISTSIPEIYYRGFKYKDGNILDANSKQLTNARQNYYKSVLKFYGTHRKGDFQLKNKKYWIDAYLD